MPQLICPVCGSPLFLLEKTYRCENGHCYDRAKSGYVNLTPPSSGKKRHGDDKCMVLSRTRFLDKGYYDPLSRAVSRCVDDLSPAPRHIVDAGCGEGKYTADLLQQLKASGKEAEILGIDISKEALIGAARRSRELCLCAASTAHMPLADGSADLVLNLFSPFMTREFARILRPGGKLLRVVPLERHLWELKELIYEKPYPNPPMDMQAEGFLPPREQRLCYEIELGSGEDIMALFQMTPYYYKTGKEDQAKARLASHLKTRLEFGIYLYEKE